MHWDGTEERTRSGTHNELHPFSITHVRSSDIGGDLPTDGISLVGSTMWVELSGVVVPVESKNHEAVISVAHPP